MDDREERQLNALLVHPLGTRFVPIVEETVTAGTEDKMARAQIGQLNERFAGLEGHLFGRDGTNGAFGELKTDIKTMLSLQHETMEQVTNLCQKQSSDVQAINMSLALQKKDLDNVGAIAREARELATTVVKASSGRLTKVWAKVWPMVASVLLVGIAAAIWRGIAQMLAEAAK